MTLMIGPKIFCGKKCSFGSRLLHFSATLQATPNCSLKMQLQCSFLCKLTPKDAQICEAAVKFLPQKITKKLKKYNYCCMKTEINQYFLHSGELYGLCIDLLVSNWINRITTEALVQLARLDSVTGSGRHCVNNHAGQDAGASHVPLIVNNHSRSMFMHVLGLISSGGPSSCPLQLLNTQTGVNLDAGCLVG